MLLVLLGPLFDYIVFWGYSVYHHQKMEFAAEAASLKTLHLPANQLHWVVKNRELLINGRYFDVKKVIVSAHTNTTIVTGLFDDEETALNQQYLEQTKKERTRQQQNLLKLTFTFNSAPVCLHELPLPVFKLINSLDFKIIESKLPAPYLAVSTPPPLV